MEYPADLRNGSSNFARSSRNVLSFLKRIGKDVIMRNSLRLSRELTGFLASCKDFIERGDMALSEHSQRLSLHCGHMVVYNSV